MPICRRLQSSGLVLANSGVSCSDWLPAGRATCSHYSPDCSPSSPRARQPGGTLTLRANGGIAGAAQSFARMSEDHQGGDLIGIVAVGAQLRPSAQTPLAARPSCTLEVRALAAVGASITRAVIWPFGEKPGLVPVSSLVVGNHLEARHAIDRASEDKARELDACIIVPTKSVCGEGCIDLRLEA